MWWYVQTLENNLAFVFLVGIPGPFSPCNESRVAEHQLFVAWRAKFVSPGEGNNLRRMTKIDGPPNILPIPNAPRASSVRIEQHEVAQCTPRRCVSSYTSQPDRVCEWLTILVIGLKAWTFK